MASSLQQPELKGVVIISLPPPDNPSEGKTIWSAFIVRWGSVLRRQQQIPHQQQIPSSNSRRYLLSRRGLNLRKVPAILLAGALALAIWQWSSNFDESNKEEDDKKTGVYELYPKYGVDYHGPVGDNPQFKLGMFVERDVVRNKGVKVSSVDSVNSSTVFPIKGDVFPDGLYYVSMLIGNPPKPYHLDVDTGSDLTWLQCAAPCRSCAKGPHPLYDPKGGKLISCTAPICMGVQATHNYECKSPAQQCDYEIEYADHSSSMGVLVKDSATVLLTNGSIVRTSLAFGCAYDQQGSLATSPAKTDGVLGLSSAQISLPSQLARNGLVKNVIGHCIAGDERGGGYMFFGNDLVPWGITWVQMQGKPSMKLYHVGYPNMKLGNRLLAYTGTESNLGGVVFDSGSSFTYFTHQAYVAFVSMIKESLFGRLTQDLSDPTLPVCWQGPHPIKSVADVRHYFKPLTLDFGSSPWLIKSKKFDILPEGYLVISSQGNVCLGILDGSRVNNGEYNIIGDISLQGYMVVYDNGYSKVGWARSDCHKPPKIKAFPFF
ncbi:hypothetical protein SUGI_1058340 [Cryptomeria japonica]|uniref:aspartyl protease APCB1 n=1 Tax=Cryptomeria japonica TaxID=3369 RepID=UPI002414BFA7|nr:aspartyl protease APCB1 [Cryptomeria japonica]GLJ49819.1 hypothetical protein SUGI_1058340 [Cryptomeria japonica]